MTEVFWGVLEEFLKVSVGYGGNLMFCFKAQFLSNRPDNGDVAVGLVKFMLNKFYEKDELNMYLLNYRNSPVAGLGYFYSSQLLKSRILKPQLLINHNYDNHLKPGIVDYPNVRIK